MSEEEYDGYDLKKIGILIGGCVIAAGIILTLLFGFIDIDIELPPIKIPKTESQPRIIDNNINPEYVKYLDFGISEDDIIDIQELDCIMFEPENANYMPNDTKYTEILNQRRAEC